ncbi:hypothetical protein HS7_02300 [Sulfolobales archaeon HS-7]|nr:hypothetical protein HS7_02300 [Sulfolobales archaeon HS-7]
MRRVVDENDELGKVAREDLKKGMEEAKELGFKRINGFAVIGTKGSVVHVRNKVILVDTYNTNWDSLFRYFTFFKGYLIAGVVLFSLALLMTYLSFFTSYMNYFEPGPKIYSNILLYIISIILLFMSRTKWSYRL